MPQVIEGCEQYDNFDPTLCRVCEGGTIISPDKRSCSTIAPIENCALYSRLRCDACNPGYLYNKNVYLEYYYDFITSESVQSLQDLIIKVSLNQSQDLAMKNCKRVEVANCEDLESFKACKRCLPGYYLDNKACVSEPDQPIPNCLVYESLTVCLMCIPRYYLTDSLTCTAAVKVDNCMLYNQASSTDGCQECTANFFISAAACATRVDSLKLANCDRFEIDQDQCKTCKSNYIISSDFLLCLPVKNNCLDHQVFASDASATECTKCKLGYYIDTTNFSCKQGSVANCSEFNVNENVCAVCKQGYYLKDAVCSKHAVVEACSSYNSIPDPSCLACDLNHLLFAQTNTCVKRTVITNCETYNAQQQCSQCKAGHVVDEQGSCMLFADDLNCKIINASTCIECRDDYYLNPITNVCVSYPAYLRENCGSMEKTDTNTFVCHYCKANSWLDQSNLRKCMLDDVDNTNQVDNCQTYDYDSNNVENVCVECKTGFYLLSDSSCIEACDLTIRLVGLNWSTSTHRYLEYKYKCVVSTDTDCEMEVPVAPSTTEAYVCIKCKTGKNPQYGPSFTSAFGLYHNFVITAGTVSSHELYR